jgi:hypothetical protein
MMREYAVRKVDSKIAAGIRIRSFDIFHGMYGQKSGEQPDLSFMPQLVLQSRPISDNLLRLPRIHLPVAWLSRSHRFEIASKVR